MLGAEHPVDRLDDHEFVSWAEHAAESLRTFGYAFVRLSPGDGTTYRITIVRPIEPEQWQRWEYQAEQPGKPPPHPSTGDYYVATMFGPMYPWSGQKPGDWGYVADKWAGGHEWTARVLHRFLCALRDAISIIDDQQGE